MIQCSPIVLRLLLMNWIDLVHSLNLNCAKTRWCFDKAALVFLYASTDVYQGYPAF